MSSSQPVARDAAGLRVLLVEDEIMIALLVEEILAEFGHTVVGPASRIDRALELVASEAIDVAILDVNIDGKEVYPVAEALAARGIPFMFVSGYGTLPERFRDRPRLTKPFRQRALLELLVELGDERLAATRHAAA
jgi:CheY-like chemotaxis protein